PPFVGADNESVRVLSARGAVGPCFARLDACGADPDLIALCKRCLNPNPDERPADAGEVATAVAGLRAAADDRARRAELDRVRLEGDRAKAEAEEREFRKRRRLQGILAAALGVLLLSGLAAGWWIDRQRVASLQKEAELAAEHAERENDAARTA